MASSATDTFLEVLYDGSGLDPIEAVDFVAVHGLNPLGKTWAYSTSPLATMEHARGTWTHGVTGRIWLKDFLPREVPHARVLLFGYNANVAFSMGQEGIREHADNLLDRLRRRRVKKNKCEDRPIVFIGHSLGGLLVKQALFQARGINKYSSILKSTYGITFFGTPHHGGEGSSFGDVISGVARAILQNPSEPFLESLKNGTMFIDILKEDFTGQDAQYQIVSFYETLPLEKADHVLVPEKSAILGLPAEREMAFPVAADHLNVCRFADASGEDYEQIEESLSEMAEEAVKIFKEHLSLKVSEASDSFASTEPSATPSASDAPAPAGSSAVISSPDHPAIVEPSTVPPASGVSAPTESSVVTSSPDDPTIAGPSADPPASDVSAPTESSVVTSSLDNSTAAGSLIISPSDVPASTTSSIVLPALGTPTPTKSLAIASASGTRSPKEPLVVPPTLAASILTGSSAGTLNFDAHTPTESSSVASGSTSSASTAMVTALDASTFLKSSIPPSNTAASVRTKSSVEPPGTETVLLSTSRGMFVSIRRDDLIKLLGSKLSVPKGVILKKARIFPVWGVGGVGKTDLLHEYLSIHQSDYKLISWVDASNEDSMFQNFEALYSQLLSAGEAHLLKDLGLTEPSDPKYRGGMAEAIDWLREPGSSRWLIVFDNVRRKETLPLIENWIPRTGRCDVIVTSRLRESRNLWRQNAVEVKEMTELQTVALLFACSDYKGRYQGDVIAGDGDIALKIVRALGYLPLAVRLAGAYIGYNAITLDSYLRLYNETLGGEQSVGHEVAISNFDKIVSTVVEISFQAIKKESPHAMELFLLMGYLHHESISEELFKQASGGWQPKLKYKLFSAIDSEEGKALRLIEEMMATNTKGEWQGRVFSDAIGILKSYSFLRIQHDNIYYFNPLVHRWSREYSLTHEQTWRFRLGLFLVANAAKWRERDSFLSMSELVRHQDELRDASKEWKEVEELHDINFLSPIGAIYQSQGRMKDEENLQKQVVATKMKVLGEEHRDTLTAMASLETVYRAQSRWRDAEALGAQVLAIRKRVLGEGHPDTVLSMANLAAVYRCQGRWRGAEDMDAQALAEMKKVSSEENPTTISLLSMGKIASAHYSQGRWEESEEVEKRVLAGKKKILGDTHPETVTSMNNLALTYSKMGRSKEAEDLQLQVVAIRKKTLGWDHPDTLTSMTSLGTMYSVHERWKEAEDILGQALVIKRKKLGEAHPDTLVSMTSLGILYSSQGRLKELRDLIVEVMPTKKKVSDETNPKTLIWMANLEKIYSSQERWKEAEEVGVKMVAARKRVLGGTHLETLESMASLGFAYHSQDNFKEAEKLQLNVVAAKKKKLGEVHPETLESVDRLATTYGSQGRWKEAEVLRVQVLATRKKTLGELHPETLTSMANLAAVYHVQKRWKESEQLGEQVVAGRKKVLGETHRETLSSMGYLGYVYYALDRLEEAEKLEVQVLATMEKSLGETHPNTLAVMNNLVMTYISQGRWKEAGELGAQALAARKKVSDDMDPNTLTAMANLASVYSHQGQLEKAEEMEVQVLAARKKVLGETHPDTLETMNSLATTYGCQGHWKKAEDLQVQTVAVIKKVMGETHPDTLTAIANLASIHESQGRQQEEILSRSEVDALGERSEARPEASTSMGGPPPSQSRKRKGKGKGNRKK